MKQYQTIILTVLAVLVGIMFFNMIRSNNNMGGTADQRRFARRRTTFVGPRGNLIYR